MTRWIYFGDNAPDKNSVSGEVLHLSWSDHDALTNLSPVPEAVLLSAAEISGQGRPAEKILAICHGLGIPVSCHAAEPGEYEVTLAAILGLPLRNGPELSFPTARTDEPFSSIAHTLLAQSIGQVDDLNSLLIHVHRTLALYADLQLVVFSLLSSSELFVARDASVKNAGFQYFLRFCKQDILLENRFVDVESLAFHFLNGLLETTDGQPNEKLVSSYTSFRLQNAEGKTFGLLHLGSRQNHYFNETILKRLKSLLPFLGSTIALAVRHRDQLVRKEGLLTLFAKFLPKPIIQKLLVENKNSQVVRGRRTPVVILFSDIRSFTTITERNGAEPVVQFLNRHFQAMVGKIEEQGGVIDKFIGDAIVAIFNADDGLTGACERAVQAARDMQRQIQQVDVSAVTLDNGRYAIGIGLHAGEVVAGYIGSREKTAYTVIGKIIEHAEDLEAETKHYGVGILMSHIVAEAIRDPALRLIELGDPQSTNQASDSEPPVYTLDMMS
jgi:class 3 adenylate cyclase